MNFLICGKGNVLTFSNERGILCNKLTGFTGEKCAPNSTVRICKLFRNYRLSEAKGKHEHFRGKFKLAM